MRWQRCRVLFTLLAVLMGLFLGKGTSYALNQADFQEKFTISQENAPLNVQPGIILVPGQSTDAFGSKFTFAEKGTNMLKLDGIDDNDNGLGEVPVDDGYYIMIGLCLLFILYRLKNNKYDTKI